MHPVMQIDWHDLLVPTTSLLELVLRGSIVYLGILAAMRILRREAGELSTADLLVIVLVADAAQNAMASEYHSITEGAVLIAIIFGWSYLLDWLGYRYPWFHSLLHRAPLPLIMIRGPNLSIRYPSSGTSHVSVNTKIVKAS